MYGDYYQFVKVWPESPVYNVTGGLLSGFLYPPNLHKTPPICWKPNGVNFRPLTKAYQWSFFPFSNIGMLKQYEMFE